MNYDSQVKAPYQCMNLEEMEIMTSYPFTINPKKEHRKIANYKAALCTWLTSIKDALMTLTNCYFEELHVELSKNGRAHIHGYIGITDIAGFYAVDLHCLQELGTYCIKSFFPNKDVEQEADAWIFAHNKWSEYIKKQHEVMRIIFKDMIEYPLNINNKIK